jgi:outer membrane protein assembly factor BamB
LSPPGFRKEHFPARFQEQHQTAVSASFPAGYPAPVTGAIYFGDDGGNLHARTAGGGVLWDYSPGTGAIKNAPALDLTSGTVFFGTDGAFGNLYGVTAAAGIPVFAALPEFRVGTSSAAIDGAGDLYVGSLGTGSTGSLVKLA